jgi:hypothetical protein
MTIVRASREGAREAISAAKQGTAPVPRFRLDAASRAGSNAAAPTLAPRVSDECASMPWTIV